MIHKSSVKKTNKLGIRKEKRPVPRLQWPRTASGGLAKPHRVAERRPTSRQAMWATHSVSPREFGGPCVGERRVQKKTKGGRNAAWKIRKRRKDDRRHVKSFGQRTAFHPEKPRPAGRVLANERPREQSGERSATWKVLTDLGKTCVLVASHCSHASKVMTRMFTGNS